MPQASIMNLLFVADPLESFKPYKDTTYTMMRDMALVDFDAVLVRKAPPFDAKHIHATHLLEQGEREGGRAANATMLIA